MVCPQLVQSRVGTKYVVAQIHCASPLGLDFHPNVKLRLAKDTLVVTWTVARRKIEASARSVGGELSAGTRRPLWRRFVPAEAPDMSTDSGTWHLDLKTLVGCLDRAHQDVRTCGVPSIF